MASSRFYASVTTITTIFVLVLSAIPTEADVIQTKVVVLGAGMSGISCAKQLQDNGITDFLVVEADNRIGGRLKPFDFDGINIELGANWIEGTVGNPLWDFKDKLNLKGSISNFSDLSMYDSVTKTRFRPQDNPRWDDLQDAIEFATNLSISKRKQGDPDISIKVGLELGGWRAQDSIDQTLEWSQTDFENAHLPGESSLEHELPGDTFEFFEDEMYMITDQRGYVTVVHDLASNISTDKIMLNSEVVSVNWEQQDAVLVTLANGTVIEAEKAVVTFSIGVLQSERVQFTPPLPLWKREAILMSEMTVYTKIFMHFPYAFWDETEFFLYASNQRGYYCYWHNLNHTKYFPGSNVIMVTATKQESIRIEGQPFDVTVSEIMTVLRDMFGDDIPEPLNVKIPIWHNNPLTYGSYASWPLGLTNLHKYNLKKAVDNRIFFAGDGISQLIGYVHGAYLSGIEVATSIAEMSNLIQVVE
eukprot:TRINITY_DN7711_c0_g2_i1.p1 TRINITY_DN7711_c0_g2~~TRINITY_DN7711_c0_g2_i1.p1  ORF type:complete len:474 (+),score=136.04 TRINITY_DN7711_c0_g2_i1:86-1507(+)